MAKYGKYKGVKDPSFFGGMPSPGNFTSWSDGGGADSAPAAGSPPPEDMNPYYWKTGGGPQSLSNGGWDIPTGGPLGAPGTDFGKGPGFGQNPFTGDASEYLKQLYKANTEGFLASYDTAANRLRERLDAAAAGQSSAAASNSASRGLGFSGIQDNAQRNIENNMMREYAQGLNQLSMGFEDRRLAGLDNAFNAANALLGQGQFGDKLKFDYDKMFNDAGLAKYLLNKQIKAGKDSQEADFQKWLMSKNFDNWFTGGF